MHKTHVVCSGGVGARGSRHGQCIHGIGTFLPFPQLHHYLMQVDYTNSFGDEIKFDENGDPAAMYDLVIWQLSPSGEMEFTTIGKFDETATVGEKKLHIRRQNFAWSGNRTDVGFRRHCDGDAL